MKQMHVDDGVFKPTETSKCLIEGVKLSEKKPIESILDLGCGCGVVGIELSKLLEIGNIFASDVCTKAVDNAVANYKRLNINALVKISSTFESWNDYSFEVIVDDISGISRHVAEISPWFKDIPMCPGDDGTQNTLEVISKSREYLNEGGRLYFPTISLSDESKILTKANSIFHRVELVKEQQWFLPVELQDYSKQLQSLKNMGWIDYKELCGRMVGWTKVYQAK